MSDFINGEVKFFNNDRGFGFILYNNGENEIFFHFSALPVPDDRDNIFTGTDVEFQIAEGRRGPEATNVIIKSEVSV